MNIFSNFTINFPVEIVTNFCSMKPSYSIQQEIENRISNALNSAKESLSNGWVKEISSGSGDSEIILYTKLIPEIHNSLKVLRVHSKINSSTKNIIQAFDTENMKKWLRLLISSKTLEEIDQNNQVRLQEYKSDYSWIISNRSFCTLTSHWSNNDENEYLFINSSIHHPFMDTYKSKSILGELYNYLYCKEIDGVSNIIYCISIDPKGSIPNKIIEWNKKETFNRIITLKKYCES